MNFVIQRNYLFELATVQPGGTPCDNILSRKPYLPDFVKRYPFSFVVWTVIRLSVYFSTVTADCYSFSFTDGAEPKSFSGTVSVANDGFEPSTYRLSTYRSTMWANRQTRNLCYKHNPRSLPAVFIVFYIHGRPNIEGVWFRVFER